MVKLQIPDTYQSLRMSDTNSIFLFFSKYYRNYYRKDGIVSFRSRSRISRNIFIAPYVVSWANRFRISSCIILYNYFLKILLSEFCSSVRILGRNLSGNCRTSIHALPIRMLLDKKFPEFAALPHFSFYGNISLKKIS